uniref:Uncharacterized protein n=1 Tax=Anguilla anguilla TaxID=7936 RepID=A0A0E9R147_ANGAN
MCIMLQSASFLSEDSRYATTTKVCPSCIMTLCGCLFFLG